MIAGYKEVRDAVLIAALSSLFTGLVNLMLKKLDPKKEEEEKKDGKSTASTS